eukprot:17679-Eustigmatos_ZCMA.PRE.1
MTSGASQQDQSDVPQVQLKNSNSLVPLGPMQVLSQAHMERHNASVQLICEMWCCFVLRSRDCPGAGA